VTADAAALADTVAIQVEVSFLPIYKGQPLFANVDTFLREHGFAFHTMVGVESRPFRPLIKDADPNRGFAQVIWSNALYFRDTTGFANLARENPDAVMKIAILAHELYGAFDPAAVALQHYGAAQHQGLATAYTRALMIADPTITAKNSQGPGSDPGSASGLVAGSATGAAAGAAGAAAGAVVGAASVGGTSDFATPTRAGRNRRSCSR
jgi:hypothetical protein